MPDVTIDHAAPEAADIAAEVAEEAKRLELAGLSDAGLQRKLGEAAARAVARHWPERIRTAYWVGVSGDRDKGFRVDVIQRPKWSLAAMLGRDTYGLGAWSSDYDLDISGQRIKVALGVGVMWRYGSTDGKAEPFFGVSVRF